MLALFLVACEVPRTSGRIVIGSATDANVLLPVVEATDLDGELNELLYLGLNSARWENGALEYLIDDLSLAESWEFGPDSTTLTYRLREDAVWSDGHPIDAGDVVFTYELVRRPEIASQRVEFWENLDSVVAVDDRQVTFYFQRRYPRMLFHTGIGIVPAHVFESASADQSTLTGHPTLADPGGNLVVSGPYRVAEWQRGDRLVLEPNPRAFTARPRVGQVVFRILPEETTRLVELQNGALDMIFPVGLAQAKELAGDPRFRVETVDNRFYDYIAWSGAGFEPFGDPDVRRALSLAIDRRAILAGLGIEQFARPAAGPYPPIFRRVFDPTLEPDPYLPDSARAILAAKGWRDSDGDGVLDRGGRPFRFTLLTQAGNGRRSAAAEIIQSQYASVGIDMSISLVEFSALLDLMFEQRDFQAVLLGWQVALEPDYLVGQFWPPDHPFNITGYSSAALDSLIPLAQAAASADEAAGYWRAAARAIADERPYAFLWFFDDAVAMSERIKGTRIDTYGVYQNLHEWHF